MWSLARLATGWKHYVTDRRSAVIWTMGALFAFTVAAYGVLGQGMEFFPEMDPEQIFVDVEAPSGATLETSNEVVRRIEARTGNTKDLLHTVANIGSKGISIGGGDAMGAVAAGFRTTAALRLISSIARSASEETLS